MPLAGHGLRPTVLRRRASRPQLKRDPLGSSNSTRVNNDYTTLRGATLALTLTAGLSGCGEGRRLPPLSVGFWRQDGTVAARQALARGDTSLIILMLPDSTTIAFRRPLNLELDPNRDIYFLKYGDLGIDSSGLGGLRDSIRAFIVAYNESVFTSRFGVDPGQLKRALERHR